MTLLTSLVISPSYKELGAKNMICATCGSDSKPYSSFRAEIWDTECFELDGSPTAHITATYNWCSRYCLDKFRIQNPGGILALPFKFLCLINA